MNKFVPIYKYCEDKKVSKQNVYRWIREGKIKKEDVRVDNISVTRIRINKNAKMLN